MVELAISSPVEPGVSAGDDRVNCRAANCAARQAIKKPRNQFFGGRGWLGSSWIAGSAYSRNSDGTLAVSRLQAAANPVARIVTAVAASRNRPGSILASAMAMLKLPLQNRVFRCQLSFVAMHLLI